MNSNMKVYGVRRFCDYSGDGRCFELYRLKTNDCASFPGTRKALERYARQLNKEAIKDARAALKLAEGKE